MTGRLTKILDFRKFGNNNNGEKKSSFQNIFTLVTTDNFQIMTLKTLTSTSLFLTIRHHALAKLKIYNYENKKFTVKNYLKPMH